MEIQEKILPKFNVATFDELCRPTCTYTGIQLIDLGLFCFEIIEAARRYSICVLLLIVLKIGTAKNIRVEWYGIGIVFYWRVISYVSSNFQARGINTRAEEEELWTLERIRKIRSFVFTPIDICW
jgi:hypothetical protein